MLQAQTTSPTQPARPLSGQAKMIATWNHGIECNAAGFLALQQGGAPWTWSRLAPASWSRTEQD